MSPSFSLDSFFFLNKNDKIIGFQGKCNCFVINLVILFYVTKNTTGLFKATRAPFIFKAMNEVAICT